MISQSLDILAGSIAHITPQRSDLELRYSLMDKAAEWHGSVRFSVLVEIVSTYTSALAARHGSGAIPDGRIRRMEDRRNNDHSIYLAAGGSPALFVLGALDLAATDPFHGVTA